MGWAREEVMTATPEADHTTPPHEQKEELTSSSPDAPSASSTPTQLLPISAIVCALIALGVSSFSLYSQWHDQPIPNAQNITSPLDASHDLSALTQRLSDLEHRLTHVDTTAAQTNAKAMSDETIARLTAVETTLAALKNQTQTENPSPERLAHSLLIFIIASDIQTRINSDASYADDLALLDDSGIEHPALTFLRAHSTNAPDWPMLARDFDKARANFPRTAAASASEEPVDFIDKLWLGMKSLVRISRIDQPEPRDKTDQIHRALEQRDYASALTLWKNLPTAIQEQNQNFASAFSLALELRQNALELYRAARASLSAAQAQK
jgi:hypothetical protein